MYSMANENIFKDDLCLANKTSTYLAEAAIFHAPEEIVNM